MASAKVGSPMTSCQVLSGSWLVIRIDPAPYYSYRIAVILSKQKEVEREKAFLAAWCKHFSEVGIGQRYADLVESARKKGAIPAA